MDQQDIIENQEDEMLLQDIIEKEETDDESDDDELNKFFLLMDKAERKNAKRKQRNENQFGVNKDSWRDVQLGKVDDDEEEDSSETEDEDDYSETSKFMSLMNKAKDKNSVVKVKLVNGKMQMTKINNGYEGNLMYKAMHEKVSHRLDDTPKDNSGINQCVDAGRKPMVTIIRNEQNSPKRRSIYQPHHQQQHQPSKSGKRKFGDRMTLAEASADDFDNSQDYVDFLQDKLQGIKIKLIK